MIPAFWLRIAALALAGACVWWFSHSRYKAGYEAANTEWTLKVQAAEIEARKVADERDALAREIAGQEAKNLARRALEIEAAKSKLIAKVRPALPVYQPDCNIPESVREDIQSAIDRANGLR